jgi:hypothetical protein
MIGDAIFPPITEMTSAELHEIAEAMNKPAVKRYIRNELAANIKASINALPMKGQDPNEFLIHHATVLGAAGVWEQLHNIQTVKST